MKCNRCTRMATQKNQRYFPDEWLCTFHANIETRKGRIAKKINNATHRAESVEIQVNTSMNEFEKYRRTQVAEMRPVTESDIKAYQVDKEIHSMRDTEFKVSISDVDRKNGSPKIGDMIARNPNNHNDQWLVAEKYFNENFETI